MAPNKTGQNNNIFYLCIENPILRGVKIGSSICVAKNRKEDFWQMGYLQMIRDYNIRQALPVANKAALLVIDMQQYFDAI
jgi:hypothetical protein